MYHPMRYPATSMKEDRVTNKIHVNIVMLPLRRSPCIVDTILEVEISQNLLNVVVHTEMQPPTTSVEVGGSVGVCDVCWVGQQARRATESKGSCMCRRRLCMQRPQSQHSEHDPSLSVSSPNARRGPRYSHEGGSGAGFARVCRSKCGARRRGGRMPGGEGLLFVRIDKRQHIISGRDLIPERIPRDAPPPAPPTFAVHSHRHTPRLQPGVP
jgi:hypothetical protein